MKVAQLSERAEGDVVFRDGLGVRVRAVTDEGEVVHRFQLPAAFTPVQQAVQERVTRLTNLQHVKFARLRGFERAAGGGAPTVISAEAEGIRLSDVLLSATHGLVEVTPGQALQVTREMLAGMAVLHDSRNVTHGSLGPERLVLTPHGRVLVVEHVLAQALDKLQWPRHQLWREWRIPTPPAAGPVRFDARTDLAQAGLVVLALALGRLLEEDEYPHRLRGLLPTASERIGRVAGAARARELQAWLERLLPIDSRRPFTTVKEAQLAFEALVAGPTSGLGMSPSKVKGLVLECVALESSSASEPEAELEPAPGIALGTAPTPESPIVLETPTAGDVEEVREPNAEGAASSVPEPAPGTGAEATFATDVDIEALLRLAAELEEKGGTSDDEAAPDASAPAAERSLPVAFELVDDEPQEEPSEADVSQVVEEIDLGAPLALLTDSQPVASPAWDVASGDLRSLATERDELQQQFADILSIVAPEAPAASSLVQPAIRWTFEAEPSPELADDGFASSGEGSREPLTAEPLTAEPLTAESHTAEPLTAEPLTSASPSLAEHTFASFGDSDADLLAMEPPVGDSEIALVDAESSTDTGAIETPRADVGDAPPAPGAEATEIAEVTEAAAHANLPDAADVAEFAEVPGSVEVPDAASASLDAFDSLTAEPLADTSRSLTYDGLASSGEAAREPLTADPLTDAAPSLTHDGLASSGETGHEPLTAEPLTVGPLTADPLTADSPSLADDPLASSGEAGCEPLTAEPPTAEPHAAAPLTAESPIAPLDDAWPSLVDTSPTLADDSPSLTDNDFVSFGEAAREPLTAEPLTAHALAADPLTTGSPSLADAPPSLAEHTFASFGEADREPLTADPLTADALTADPLASDSPSLADDPLASSDEAGCEPLTAEPLTSDSFSLADDSPSLTDNDFASFGEADREPLTAEPLTADALTADPPSLADDPLASSGEAGCEPPTAEPHAAAPLTAESPIAPLDDAWPSLVDTSPALADDSPSLTEHTLASFGEADREPLTADPHTAEPLTADALTSDSPLLADDPLASSGAADRGPLTADSLTADPLAADSPSLADDPLASSDEAGCEPLTAEPPTAEPHAAAPLTAESPIALLDDAWPSLVDTSPALADAPPSLAEHTLASFGEADREPLTAEPHTAEPLTADALTSDSPLLADDPLASSGAAEREPLTAEPHTAEPLTADALTSDSPSLADDPPSLAHDGFASFGEADREPIITEPFAAEPLTAPLDDVSASLANDSPSLTHDSVVRRGDPDADLLASEPPAGDSEVALVDAGPSTDAGPLEVPREGVADVVDEVANLETEEAIEVAKVAKVRKSKRRRSRRKTKPVAPIQSGATPEPRSVREVPTPLEPGEVPSMPVVPDVPAAIDAPVAIEPPSVAADLSAPSSLVEREVPAWQPPSDLRAVGAAAAAGRSPRGAGPDAPSEAGATREPVAQSSSPSPLPTASGIPAGTYAPPVATFEAASIVPDEYLPPGSRQSLPSPLAMNGPALIPQVTTVGDPGYSSLTLSGDGVPKPRTVVVFTSQINWRRTVAAAILLALLESAAFAAAWWWVQPGARGTLVVETSVPGVEVLLDGVVVGHTPFHDDVRPGRHTLTLRRGGLERNMPVEISLGVVTTQTLSWPAASTGALRVTSSPDGAEVVIGGRVRGRTPLSIDGLDAGRHTLVVRSTSGTVSTTATVVGGETTAVDVPIFAGWVVVHAPVDLDVMVDGTHVGSSLDGQMLLAPGGHRIVVSNATLGFTQTLDASVEPGKVHTLTVLLPDVPVQAPGEDGAEIFVDGASRGVLPDVTVPLGTHEVVVRRPDGTERRRTLTVRADAPVILD